MMIFNDYPSDAENLDAFFRNSEKALYAYAFRILKNSQLAEDAFQAAIESLIRSYDLVRDMPQPRLYRYSLCIISHECGAILKANKHEVACEEIDWMTEDISQQTDIFDRIDQDSIRKSISQLPDKYRTAIVMKYYDNADDEMIAAVLKVKKSSVRMILSRAKAKLKKLYIEAEEEVCKIVE